MPMTKYIWDVESDNVLTETDENDVTTVVYTSEPDQFGNLISQRRGSTTSTYHFDALSSTRELTDSTENTTDTYTYTAFGESVATTGTATNPFRYVGGRGYYYDEETEDYYVRARSYQPRIARWKSLDLVLSPKWLNRYTYGFNNPLNMIDPSGAEPICSLEFVEGAAQIENTWVHNRVANERMTVRVDYGRVVQSQLSTECGTIQVGFTVSAVARGVCQVGAKRLIDKVGGVNRGMPKAKLVVTSIADCGNCTATPWKYHANTTPPISETPAGVNATCPSLSSVITCAIPCKPSWECVTDMDGDIYLHWEEGQAKSRNWFLVRSSYFLAPEHEVGCCEIFGCEIKMINRSMRLGTKLDCVGQMEES